MSLLCKWFPTSLRLWFSICDSRSACGVVVIHLGFGPNVVIQSGSCDCEVLMVCARRANDIDALSGRWFYSMMVGFFFFSFFT